MPATFQTGAGGLWAEQPAGARLDYSFDWALDGGDTIATSTWTASPGTTPPLLLSGQTHEANRSTVFVAGGVPGAWYSLTNTITTAAGRTDQQGFMLLVSAGAPATARSALFPFPPAAVASIRRSRLVNLATSLLAGITLTDDAIWAKLMAAEAEVERALRVWLSPREVLPAHESYDDEADALIAAGQRVEREPGYDYSPAMFQGDRWGMLELRQRPILRIHWARFAYPLPGNTVVELPRDWLRPEGKTNRVSILPTSTPARAPLNAFILSAIGGSRTVPFMLQVAYRAGLADVRETLPDLPALVERLATVNLVEDQLLPQSASVSVDGMSRSLSYESAQHREKLEEKLDHMRDRLQGVRVGFA